MAKRDRQRPESKIDLSHLPEKMQRMVTDGEKLSVDEWKVLTQNWSEETKQMAIVLKKMGRNKRIRTINLHQEHWKKQAEEAMLAEDSMVPITAMLYMSDEALRKIIDSFGEKAPKLN